MFILWTNNFKSHKTGTVHFWHVLLFSLKLKRNNSTCSPQNLFLIHKTFEVRKILMFNSINALMNLFELTLWWLTLINVLLLFNK